MKFTIIQAVFSMVFLILCSSSKVNLTKINFSQISKQIHDNNEMDWRNVQSKRNNDASNPSSSRSQVRERGELMSETIDDTHLINGRISEMEHKDDYYGGGGGNNDEYFISEDEKKIAVIVSGSILGGLLVPFIYYLVVTPIGLITNIWHSFI